MEKVEKVKAFRFRNSTPGKNGTPMPLTNVRLYEVLNYPSGPKHQGKRFEGNSNPVAKYPARPNGNSPYIPPEHWRKTIPGVGHMPSAESAEEVAKNLAKNPNGEGFYNALALKGYYNHSSKEPDNSLVKFWKIKEDNPYAQEVLKQMAVEELIARKEKEEPYSNNKSKGGSYQGRRRKSRRMRKRRASRRTSKK